MNEAYTLAFDFDFGEDVFTVAVLDHDRSGNIRLVNMIQDDATVRDLYELVTGHELEDY